MLVTFDENGMPIYDLDAAIDITRISLIEEGKEFEQKDIITKLISNGMSIEELSQKLNMSIADINNILNQNVTSWWKEVRFCSYFFYVMNQKRRASSYSSHD